MAISARQRRLWKASTNTMHIQEAHLVIEHIFAALVESELEGW